MAWWQGKQRVREYLRKLNEKEDVRLPGLNDTRILSDDN
jgi:hypothetical protein